MAIIKWRARAPRATVTPPSATLPPMNDLAGKHIVLGLSGGIACYKSAELCRQLTKAGATVQVVMTASAERFITATTMQALSGRVVRGSQWDPRESNAQPHTDLTRETERTLGAPRTAQRSPQLAQGRADELLGLLCLARPMGTVPLLLAPAMNREMWAHPATQRNVAQVRADGATVLAVGQGDQACGETGDGRMLEPDELLHDLVHFFQPKTLVGQHVLVSAGPTFEAIDPVRGITNKSSGKMGFAVARAAREAGAEVTLVAGPVALPTPRGVRRVDVSSAHEMLVAVEAAVPQATVFVATAAVADWRPAQAATHQIQEDGHRQVPALALEENPGIPDPRAPPPPPRSGALFCVGFAAESHDLAAHAKAKRERKGVPLLVGNIGPATFGQDDNALLLVDAEGARELPQAGKLALARQLVADIARRLPG